MRSGPSNRFGIIVLLIISLVLVLISFWVLEVMRRSAQDSAPAQQRVDPDYFIENFTYLRLSEAGGVRYNVTGSRLEHNPVDGTHHVNLPKVISYTEDRPPVTSTALRGIVSADNTEVHLYDDVHVDRPQSLESKHFHLVSDYLLVLTEEDIVRTDKPVEITIGTSILRGKGMVADNALRQLDLHRDVHTTFPPADKSR